MTDQETIARLQREVEHLRDWQGSINVERAAEKVRMNHIDEKLEKISAGINRLVWIVAGAVVMAFASWMLNGGLANVAA